MRKRQRERDFDIFFNCFETIDTFPYRCVKTLVHTAHSMCEILSRLNQVQYLLSPGQSLQLPSATAARMLPIKESLGEKKKKKMEIHTIHIIIVSSKMKFSNWSQRLLFSGVLIIDSLSSFCKVFQTRWHRIGLQSKQPRTR